MGSACRDAVRHAQCLHTRTLDGYCGICNRNTESGENDTRQRLN